MPDGILLLLQRIKTKYSYFLPVLKIFLANSLEFYQYDYIYKNNFFKKQVFLKRFHEIFMNRLMKLFIFRRKKCNIIIKNIEKRFFLYRLKSQFYFCRQKVHYSYVLHLFWIDSPVRIFLEVPPLWTQFKPTDHLLVGGHRLTVNPVKI